VSSDGSDIAWLAGLSPWPVDGFGLDRIERLCDLLGRPQREVQCVHVVGTNGKSTATRMIESLLLAEGVATGAFVSPHVERWSERIRVNGQEADLERVLGLVRPGAEAVGATQFETLTAAALVALREGGATAAVVEAGLGGRLDATNVLDRVPTVVLTNVGLEHTDVLGDTREAIAREKLAVVHPGAGVVLGEPEWEGLAWLAGASEVGVVTSGDPVELARVATEAFLGYVVDDAPARSVTLPGRLERRDGEVRDGAHNPDGARWLARSLAGGRYTLCVSLLADKDVDAILEELASLGDTLVATTSTSPRALPAAVLAEHARRWFHRVEAVEPAPTALARAHALGEPVLVSGSLYLLADLAAAEVGR
jgi:dihydrofolate synthase/folylpolyglutamate synthase